VGFGDITAQGDVARTFVIMQLAAGSILISWALAVLLSDPLPVPERTEND
jgi:hypothetical protein